MALCKDIQYKGFEAKGAYFKITRVDGSKESLQLQVRCYREKESEFVLGEKYYALIPTVADGSPNFIAQGYQYLKTLPEFADAVDC